MRESYKYMISKTVFEVSAMKMMRTFQGMSRVMVCKKYGITNNFIHSLSLNFQMELGQGAMQADGNNNARFIRSCVDINLSDHNPIKD